MYWLVMVYTFHPLSPFVFGIIIFHFILSIGLCNIYTHLKKSSSTRIVQDGGAKKSPEVVDNQIFPRSIIRLGLLPSNQNWINRQVTPLVNLTVQHFLGFQSKLTVCISDRQCSADWCPWNHILAEKRKLENGVNLGLCTVVTLAHELPSQSSSKFW